MILRVLETSGGFEFEYILFSFFFFLFFFSTFFIYFLDRERQSMNGGGAERGRHRIGNRLQAPSHLPRARRGARTPGPRDRDLAEVGRLTDCATQAPQHFVFFRERERPHAQGRGAERERGIPRRLHAQHRARRGAQTHDPGIRT